MEITSEDSRPQDFQSLSYYSPPDARKLFDAFDTAGIPYDAEMKEDQSIGADVHDGAFGDDVQLHVFIDGAFMDEVVRVHTAVFGDCLSNYD